MPPKKKCTRKTRKAELVFLERPWEGPIHCAETPLYVAENPICVSTKPVDQNTSAAWVGICYQFLCVLQKQVFFPHLNRTFCVLTMKINSMDLNSL